MSSSAANPVLAPIRRWVLYSRTNLTITIVSAFGVLFVAGAVFGQPPDPVEHCLEDPSLHRINDRNSVRDPG